MGKAILAAIVTLIVGYLGMVVGLELLGNWLRENMRTYMYTVF